MHNPMSSKVIKQLFTGPDRLAFQRAPTDVPGRISLSPLMNQIDSSTLLAQGGAFFKRTEKHTIVPIQEEDLHWEKKDNMNVEGNPPMAHFSLPLNAPQESHDPSELEKRNIASVEKENLDLAHQNKLTKHALSGDVSSEKFEESFSRAVSIHFMYLSIYLKRSPTRITTPLWPKSRLRLKFSRLKARSSKRNASVPMLYF